MKSKTKTARVHRFAKQEFWLGILATDTRHHSGSGGSVDNVDQIFSPWRVRHVLV